MQSEAENAESSHARETERLSRHDSAFMFLDNDIAVHEGYGLNILDGPVPFENMRHRTLSVIPEVPKFLQRPVYVPFGLGHPTWEYDPDFDPNYHLQRLHLEPPGTEDQLWELIESLANKRLDPSRPLWRTYLIEGLEGGRCAMFSQIHHALTDGMGALKVMMANIEMEPIFPEPIAPGTPLPAMPAVPPDPTAVRRIARALRDNGRAWAHGIRTLPNRLQRYWRRITSRHFWQGLALTREYLKSPTIRFPFNRGLSGRVHFGTLSLPLAEMRAIRAKAGGTINDVLLATVAGGFDKYAVRNGHDTAGKFMRLQVPMNIRTEETDVPLGNHVGSIPVLVPFGVAHPVERLHGITASMRRAKDCNVGYGVRVFLDGLEALLTPPGMRVVFGIASLPIVQKFMAALPRKPSLHLYVSNIPGPEFPTYAMGREYLVRQPMGPVIPQSGLSCAAMTCDKHLHVTFTADKASVPDVRKLAEETAESFAELRRAAGVESTAAAPFSVMPEGLAK